MWQIERSCATTENKSYPKRSTYDLFYKTRFSTEKSFHRI